MRKKNRTGTSGFMYEVDFQNLLFKKHFFISESSTLIKVKGTENGEASFLKKYFY